MTLAKFRAFAESMKTADVTLANTLQASQKITSILAKYASALLALAKKTVHNGGKGKIYDKNIKRNNSGYRMYFSLYNAWTTFIKKVKSWQELKVINKRT